MNPSITQPQAQDFLGPVLFLTWVSFSTSIILVMDKTTATIDIKNNPSLKIRDLDNLKKTLDKSFGSLPNFPEVTSKRISRQIPINL